MRYLVSAFCLAVLGLAPPAYAEDKALEFILQGPYTLQPDHSEAVLHIPVRTVEGLEIEGLVASFRSQDPLLVSNAFTARIEPQQGRTQSQLKLTLKKSAIPGETWYGTYHLVLDVSFPKEKVQQNKKGEEVKVTVRERNAIPLDVVYPETKVFPPQPLLVRDTWFLWHHWDTEASPLSLEVQEGPALAELSVYQAGAAKFGNDPVAGQLQLGEPEYKNRVAQVPVGIREGFPTGDVSGEIRMAAPGMERKNVAFTVRTRQHKGLIFIVAAIGLLIGFLLRTGSDAWIEGRRNRVQLQRLLLRVREARGLGTDMELDGTLTELEQEIEKAVRELKTTPQEDFPAKLNSLQERLKNARTAFTDKRNTIAQSASDREALLRAAWQVPPVARPKGDLSAVRSALDKGDLETAATELKKFDDELRKRVTGALKSWRETINLRFQDLGVLEFPLPESAQTILDQELPTNKNEVAGEKTDDLTTVKSALTQADQDYQRIVGLVESLRNETYQVAGRVCMLLKGKAKEETLRNLEEARQELAEMKPGQVVDEPDAGFKEMAGSLGSVTEALWNAIDETYAAVLPANAKAQLKAGKYEEAAAQAPIPGQLGLTAPERIPYTPPAPRPPLQPPPVTQGAPVQLHALAAAEPLEAQIKKAWREIAAGKAIQSLGAGLGLALIAYLIFADSFIGTPVDFIKIFFYGFTTDVGVNVLLEKASSAKPK